MDFVKGYIKQFNKLLKRQNNKWTSKGAIKAELNRKSEKELLLKLKRFLDNKMYITKVCAKKNGIFLADVYNLYDIRMCNNKFVIKNTCLNGIMSKAIPKKSYISTTVIIEYFTKYRYIIEYTLYNSWDKVITKNDYYIIPINIIIAITFKMKCAEENVDIDIVSCGCDKDTGIYNNNRIVNDNILSISELNKNIKIVNLHVQDIVLINNILEVLLEKLNKKDEIYSYLTIMHNGIYNQYYKVKKGCNYTLKDHPLNRKNKCD